MGYFTVTAVLKCCGCLVKLHLGPPQGWKGKYPASPPSSPAFSNAERSHGGLICVLFRQTYKDNKHCTGNYNNYNNLIMVMRMIMMRTAWTWKSNLFQTRMTSCWYSMCVEYTVLWGLTPCTCVPGNTLILQKKKKKVNTLWFLCLDGRSVSIWIHVLLVVRGTKCFFCGYSVIINMFTQTVATTPLHMLEGNLDKSHRQFNSHDPPLLAAALSP